MAAILFHEPVFATIVESGDQLYFYEVGTTTDLTVYLDSGLSTPAPQPIVADSAGRFPTIYLDGTGNPPKVVLDDSDDVQKWTTDEYPIDDSAALASDVAQLQTDVEAVEGDLLTAESEIDQLEVDVADHEGRITALEDETGVADLQDFVDRFAANVGAGNTWSFTIPYSDTEEVVVNVGQTVVGSNDTETVDLDKGFTTKWTGGCSYFNDSDPSIENCASVTGLTTSTITVLNGKDSSTTISWWAVGTVSI